MNDNVKYDRAHGNTANNVSKIPDAGVPPQPFVKLERNKSQPSNYDEPGHHRDHARHLFIRNDSVKPDPESQIIREHDQYNMESYNQKSPVCEKNGFNHGSCLQSRPIKTGGFVSGEWVRNGNPPAIGTAIA